MPTAVTKASKANTVFAENIKRSRHFLVLRKKLLDAGETEKEVIDLLRAGFAWAVASLDAYVHDKISEELLGYMRLLITLPSGTEGEIKKKSELLQPLIKFLDDQRKEDRLTHTTYWALAQKPRPFGQIRGRIEQFLLLDSYQEPSKIQNALELIGCKNIFDAIAGSGTKERKELWKRLDEYSKRRNKIVHEGDRMRGKKGGKKPRAITQTYVTKAITEIESFVNKLDAEIGKQLKANETLKPKKPRGRPTAKKIGRPRKAP